MDLPPPFNSMTYGEAMSPSVPTRRTCPPWHSDVTDMVRSGLQGLLHPANSGNGRVAALRVPGGAAGDKALTRGEIDELTKFVGIYGARGLAYIKVNDVTQPNEQGLQSPIVKNLHEAALKGILEKTGAQSGDLIFFGADKAKVVNDALGALRIKLGHDKGYVTGEAWRPLWVVDFPMFEYDEETARVPATTPSPAPRMNTWSCWPATRASAWLRPTIWP